MKKGKRERERERAKTEGKRAKVITLIKNYIHREDLVYTHTARVWVVLFNTLYGEYTVYFNIVQNTPM